MLVSIGPMFGESLGRLQGIPAEVFRTPCLHVSQACHPPSGKFPSPSEIRALQVMIWFLLFYFLVVCCTQTKPDAFSIPFANVFA